MKNYTFPFDLAAEIAKADAAYPFDGMLYEAAVARVRFAAALAKVYDDARLAARAKPLPGYGDNVFSLHILRAVRKAEANDE